MSTVELPLYSENDVPAPKYEDRDPASSDLPDFPDDIEIYRTRFPNFLIASPLSSSIADVHPISYVGITLSTTSHGISMTPGSTIKVHSGPEATSRVVGGVKLRYTPSTDLTIYDAPRLGKPCEASNVKLSHGGIATPRSHSFMCSRDGGEEEKLEWLHTGCEEVKKLASENLPGEDFSQHDRGMKLISSGSRTLLAVYCSGTRSSSLNPRKVAGKLRFIPETSEMIFGAAAERERRWRLTVVLSVLTMMERGRQTQSRNGE